jgi:RNA polymerase sigma-70 factor, ECF subfamily
MTEAVAQMLQADVLLVERCRQADARAFDEIVQRYKNKIFNYVSRMTNDSPDAEDITQEVFIKAYVSIGAFRNDASVDTWLYRIATNLVIDRFRRGKRAPQTISAFEDESHPLHELPATERGSDPAVQAQLTELQCEVKRAVAALPPKLRSAVVMHDLEGLSYEEVAEAVGCPVGTVKSRLFNGRNLLKEKLRRYVETG